MNIGEIKELIDGAVLDSKDEIESFRVKVLGRKQGLITGLFSQISTVPPAERGSYGQQINQLKSQAEARIEAALAAQSDTPAGGDLDLTLPARPILKGSLHPITQTREEIKRIFGHFGFSVAEGPEMEDDWHNFTALNFPADHPARDMQDTTFVEGPNDRHGGILMRTHTSPVQIRAMKESEPPFRLLVPGRVYRNESISYKSYCFFHQVEGLCVDEHATFADLREILNVFSKAMFGSDVKMRFRPSFFPFTEPSAEVDIWWRNEDGSGKWLEILGCGMVDPTVLTAVDIDPERFSGYAFGMGIDRITMIRHGIEDIRLLFENDVRFLQQF